MCSNRDEVASDSLHLEKIPNLIVDEFGVRIDIVKDESHLNIQQPSNRSPCLNLINFRDYLTLSLPQNVLLTLGLPFDTQVLLERLSRRSVKQLLKLSSIDISCES